MRSRRLEAHLRRRWLACHFDGLLAGDPANASMPEPGTREAAAEVLQVLPLDALESLVERTIPGMGRIVPLLARRLAVDLDSPDPKVQKHAMKLSAELVASALKSLRQPRRSRLLFTIVPAM